MRILTVFLLLIPVCGGAEAGEAARATRLPAKRIALSFDDAPRRDGPVFTGDARAAALLRALEKAETGPVVFFVTTKGFNWPGGRERIEQYAQAGHLIANHTHFHRWLTRTDVQEYIADIDEAERRLKGFPNRRPWFRFPFLDEGTPLEKRNAIRAALAGRGLGNGYVTVDNYEWYIEARWQKAVNEGRAVNMEALRNAYIRMLTGAVAFYDALAVDTIGRSPVHMLLLHENDLAALFVDDLVSALRAEGWTIVSADEAYADPIADILPRTLMTRQGQVAALAVDAGRSPSTLVHLAIDEAQIDALLDELGVFGTHRRPVEVRQKRPAP